MTYQELLNLVNYDGLTPITFFTPTGTQQITARFGDAFGNYVAPAITLSINATASSLLTLTQQYTLQSTFPPQATFVTITGSSQHYVGFNARTDGTINPNGTTHRLLVSGTYYLGKGSRDSSAAMPVVAEDSPFNDTDRGLGLWSVRQDTAASTAGSSGDYQPIITDANGCVWVNLNTLLAGEDLTTNRLLTENRYVFATITASGTNTIKSGPGFLHRVLLLGGTAGAITAYDNTAGSGTAIWPTTTLSTVSPPVSLEFNCTFSTGLTIVTGTAMIVVLIYR
jgi:hypothetical protein